MEIGFEYRCGGENDVKKRLCYPGEVYSNRVKKGLRIVEVVIG
jgi:hypothetical protein